MAAALCLAAAAAKGEPGVTANRVQIGLIVPLSGPLAARGWALRAGWQAALDAANADGGIHGRELRLIPADDGGEPQRAQLLLRAMVSEGDGVLALGGFVGAATVQAVLPALLAGNTPVVGLASSAEPAPVQLRRPLWMSHAGMREQVNAALVHIEHLGIEQPALVAGADAFGQAAWDTTHTQLVSVAQRPALALRLAAPPLPDAAFAQAARQLRDSGARAAVLALEGLDALRLVRALRPPGGPTLYLLHDAWATLSALGHGPELAGVVVALALPNPAQQSLRFVADFQRQAPAGPGNSAALEGWLNGRILVEALRRCPREPLRACVADALDGRALEMGGWRVQPNAQTRRSSRWVDMALVGKDGRLLH